MTGDQRYGIVAESDLSAALRRFGFGRARETEFLHLLDWAVKPRDYIGEKAHPAPGVGAGVTQLSADDKRYDEAFEAPPEYLLDMRSIFRFLLQLNAAVAVTR